MLTISNNLYKELGSFLNMDQQSSSSDNNNSSNESNNNVKDRLINNMAEIIIDIVDKPTLQKALTTLASRFIKTLPTGISKTCQNFGTKFHTILKPLHRLYSFSTHSYRTNGSKKVFQ